MTVKYAAIGLILTTLIFGFTEHKITTKAIVTLVGAKIKSDKYEVVEKYKRKDCPVCKGKGWYMSGDDIEKIQCSYCEEDSLDKDSLSNTIRK